MELEREQKVLLRIETEDFSLYIKGVPYSTKYYSLKQYRSHLTYEQETMELIVKGDTKKINVFNVASNCEEAYEHGPFPPIFFENGIYQFVLIPKTKENLSFNHEYPGFQKAISWVGEEEHAVMMGQLDFRNEIGFSTFFIKKNGKDILEVTLEIFPTKLSYKEDYDRLLMDVNDEIYNLAFHFLRKTYAKGRIVSTSSQSMTEFFRLIEHYFLKFTQAIKRIESMPHYQLQKTYEFVRADQIKKSDQRTFNFLIRRPKLLIEVPKGFRIKDKNYLPIKGLNLKKKITYDNLENRFVKWMMQRIVYKLNDLLSRLKVDEENNNEVIRRVWNMKKWLEDRLLKPFWFEISKLDRTVFNLVMQMQVGYRDALKIYLILMKGITLQGELLKISLKDVAKLYEYWTYLKIGQILRKHYHLESQTVIRAKYGSLYVYLDETKHSKQIFRHPQTEERIILSYQKKAEQLPTVKQIPDIMLEIEKYGVPYTYNYIFDAKYRIDFYEKNDGAMDPGPLEEDINTMHRYRDALVVKNGGPYERYAFGAYVLFPWHDEDNYEHHQFYKSINEVNIGGLPFLPNSVKLVERLIDRLVNSNPEDLQEEGILPRGSIAHWESNLEEKVLVVSVNESKRYQTIKENLQLEMNVKNLKKDWEKAKYIALYVTKNVSKELNIENGIYHYSEIENVDIITTKKGAFVQFQLKPWNTLKNPIRPVGYGIQSMIVTTINLLKEAKELPELFMKFGEEKKLWRMLRRLTSNVKTLLDSAVLDKATKIQAYQIGFYSVDLDVEQNDIQVTQNDELITKIPLKELQNEPNTVFKRLKEIIFHD